MFARLRARVKVQPPKPTPARVPFWSVPAVRAALQRNAGLRTRMRPTLPRRYVNGDGGLRLRLVCWGVPTFPVSIVQENQPTPLPFFFIEKNYNRIVMLTNSVLML